jgi:hypothetical protein
MFARNIATLTATDLYPKDCVEVGTLNEKVNPLILGEAKGPCVAHLEAHEGLPDLHRRGLGLVCIEEHALFGISLWTRNG